MRASCLCGSVKFQISGELPIIYQCHCSLCHEQGGWSSSSAMVIKAADLSWTAGQDLVTSYVNPTGFRSDFCSRCGSPVPNPLRSTSYYWVPAGLFDDEAKLEIGAQLYVDSKAPWDDISPHGERYGTAPDASDIIAVLRPDRVERYATGARLMRNWWASPQFASRQPDRSRCRRHSASATP